MKATCVCLFAIFSHDYDLVRGAKNKASGAREITSGFRENVARSDPDRLTRVFARADPDCRCMHLR